MGFSIDTIVGNGAVQPVVINDLITEAVINGLIVHNSTGGDLSFKAYIGGTPIFTEVVIANSTFRMPDKINLGTSKTFSLEAPDGLTASVSYFQQVPDVATGLTQVQSHMATTESYKNAAEAAALAAAADVIASLPEGSISNDVISSNTTWSSEKMYTTFIGMDCGGATTISGTLFDLGSAGTII